MYLDIPIHMVQDSHNSQTHNEREGEGGREKEREMCVPYSVVFLKVHS